MDVLNIRVYNRERYLDYVKSIMKYASSTVILLEYLNITNRIKETLPAGVMLEIKRLKQQHYCIYLRYQHASNKKMYEMLDNLEERYARWFPDLCKDAGFVDRGNMYLVLRYYMKKM